MELTLFLSLAAIGFTLIFLGYYSKERAYSLAGFSFLFILGFWVMMPSGIEIPNTDIITYNYTNTTLTSTTITPHNTTINDTVTRFFGVWIALIGALGIAINITEIKRGLI